jgi:hypothetical protein
MNGTPQNSERLFVVLRGPGPADNSIGTLDFLEPFGDHLRIQEKDREWRPTGSESELSRILVVPPFSKDDPKRREAAVEWMEAGSGGGSDAQISVKAGDASVLWRQERAVVAYGGGQLAEVLEAVVEFSFIERLLSGLEREVSLGWPGVEQDTPLAYKIEAADLDRDREIGLRARSVLQLRMRHVRAEPLVARAPVRFGRLAAELGEELREQARFEQRLEVLDGQIEVQEYVYELASQRLGEYRHAREGFIIEVVIVALLAAEVVLLLLDLWFSHRQ